MQFVIELVNFAKRWTRGQEKREQNNANDECIKVPVYVTTEPTIPILCVAEDQSPEEGEFFHVKWIELTWQ